MNFLPLVWVLVGLTLGQAGTPPAPNPSTRVVMIPAIVRAKNGDPAEGLTRDDFVLKEDGKVQPIQYFSEGSDLPLTLLLVVDVSASQRAFVKEEAAASKLFFPQILKRPEDRAALLEFDSSVRKLSGMTNDANALEAALGHLADPPGAGAHRAGGTMLYDAMVTASRTVIGREPGRRAMVLLTDGGDTISTNDLKQAVGEALAADVVIYPIFYSEGHGLRGGDGLNALQGMADSTGGQVFTVTREHPLKMIYGQIEEAMRLQYQIGYTPPESARGKYHVIDLKAKNSKMTVNARRGYFSKGAAAQP